MQVCGCWLHTTDKKVSGAFVAQSFKKTYYKGSIKDFCFNKQRTLWLSAFTVLRPNGDPL